jgi:hypothetical protein
MFVQVIKGKTPDRAAVRRRHEVWRDEVKPGAVGFLGGTIGVADDGTVIALARFADEDSAKRNADRPEQDAWWEGTAALLDEAPTFRGSSDVEVIFDAGCEQAGFVQVMEGKAADRAKVEAMQTPELLDQLRAARPDLLGSIRVWYPDDSFVQAAYFTGEDAARRGETAAEFAGPRDDYAALFADMTYTDLREPMLVGG